LAGRRRALLGGLAFAGLASLAFAAELPIRAARWIKGADPVATLTTAPPECLRQPLDGKARQSIEIGRAVFRSPTLLGGQAARAGVSCESCHRSGRGNPAFSFPGLSGEPGTADVTSALFSSFRDDGVFNPKPIPDLAAPKEARADMEGFLHGLVVEEFNGVPPPPEVMQGLADYVRAIDPKVCPPVTSRPVTLRRGLEDARRAVDAARAAQNSQVAVILIQAARSMLGEVDERYAGNDPARALIRQSSRDLAIVESEIRAGRPGAKDGLVLWLARSATLETTLARTENRSLYDPATVQAALDRP